MTKTPPYLGAKKIVWTSTTNRTCTNPYNADAAKASANRTSGNAAVYACAVHHTASAESEAGFLLPFKVRVAGNHTVVVNWSVSYSSRSYIYNNNACFHVYLNILDPSKGTRIGSGPSYSDCRFLSVSKSVSISWTGPLISNHSYSVQTFLDAYAYSNLGCGRYGCSGYNGLVSGSGSLARVQFI